MNETHITSRQQLELTFGETVTFAPHIRRARLSRAQWWFAQMRAVVDRALDWKPAPRARPEQVHLTLVPGR
jgi:hypothetical protein